MNIDPPLDVLLVEDNPGDARLIRALLAETTHTPVRLVHVECLEAFRERLGHTDVDVVLLDLGLPDSQGLETLLQVRDAVPRLPIVVLSGHADATLALRAVREGAQEYLLKGHVDAEVLARTLRNAVEHKRIEEHQKYLSEVSRVLAGSLDYETTVEHVVRLPVPVLAQACILELQAEGCSRRRLVVYSLDAAVEDALREATDELSPGQTGPGLEAIAPPALQPLGFAVRIGVPLAAHGRVFGRLGLLGTDERQGFSAEESGLLEQYALHSALALDNARLHRELQEAVRLRDEVLASTSHDLRSPLSGIKLQGMLRRRQLQSGSATGDAELHDRVVRGLEQIDATVTRSVGLLEELLDAASLQAGRQLELDRRVTDLAEVVRRVVAEQQARTDFHQFRIYDAEQPLIGEWDAARLGRVMDNLLSNAVKYSRRRDIITVALSREADATCDWAVLQVQDHGVGIPPGELQHVFDRFYRGSNVPRRPGAWVSDSPVCDRSSSNMLDKSASRVRTVSAPLSPCGYRCARRSLTKRGLSCSPRTPANRFPV